MTRISSGIFALVLGVPLLTNPVAQLPMAITGAWAGTANVSSEWSELALRRRQPVHRSRRARERDGRYWRAS
jgi:hypothetical protein